MLAALGALIPELLDLVGAFHFVEPVWWRVGYSKLKVSIYVKDEDNYVLLNLVFYCSSYTGLLYIYCS